MSGDLFLDYHEWVSVSTKTVMEKRNRRLNFASLT